MMVQRYKDRGRGPPVFGPEGGSMDVKQMKHIVGEGKR